MTSYNQWRRKQKKATGYDRHNKRKNIKRNTAKKMERQSYEVAIRNRSKVEISI